MGTRITTQKRGKGSPRFRTPKHRYVTDTQYPAQGGTGQLMDFKDDPGRSVLLAKVLFEDGKRFFYTPAAEGQKQDDKLYVTTPSKHGEEPEELDVENLKTGSVLQLGSVPDGTLVFNIERVPNDGGKIARSSGTFATVVSHDEDTNKVTLSLRSKKEVVLNPLCRATIGVASGGGRLEKPIKKAGTHFYISKARGKLWPKVRGTTMSAYDHPHGGVALGKSNTVKRSTSPGRKVGLIAARRSGRGKGKKR
ncbi:MAG: 50S ribosomal protein L2 [Candidatus Micrarchaeia archaeon]